MKIPSFIKNIGTLLSGNVIAQGVAFLAYLVLGRLFSPEDFGLYNIFYSYIEVLIILSTCKYELAIVIADNDNEAADLARLTLRLNAIISAALLAVATILYFCLPSSAVQQMVIFHSPLLLLIPFMVFFCGTTRVYTFLFNRHQKYKPIALSEVITSLSGVVTKIVLGLLNSTLTIFHALGLPLGTVLGKVAGNTYYRIAVKLNHLLDYTPTDTGNKALLRKYRNFPLYATPKELVSSLSANLPFLWLSIYFDNALLGLFSLALTFTSRPVNILANAFEKVFYASVSKQVTEQQPVMPSIRKFAVTLNAIALPVVVLAFFFAEPVFTWLFGEKWVGTGYYVRCILPWIWVLLTANSLQFVANVFSTQRIDFFIQIAQLVLRILALGVGCYAKSFHLAILLFCLVSLVMQIVQLAWYFIQLHRHDRRCQHITAS